MLPSVEQAFVGRDETRAPLKTPAWEAMKATDQNCLGFRQVQFKTASTVWVEENERRKQHNC